MPCAHSHPSVTRLLQHWAVTQPVTVALRFEDRSWTWTELLDRVRRLAGALREAGIGAGDRIAFLGRNHPAALELVLAGAWIGAATVVVNYRLAPAEIDHVVQDADAAVVVVRPEFAPVLADLGYQRRVVAVGPEYEEWLESAAPPGEPRDADVDEPFLQLYTSGTTGVPKGAMLTHRNLAAHSEAVSTHVGLTRTSVDLVPMPLYHVGGLAWALLALHRGATLILVPDVRPAQLVDMIETFRVTHAFVVPTVLAGLVELPDLAERDLSSLRGLTYGGSPMPLPLLRRLLAMTDAGLYQVYGATEVSGVATVLDSADHRAPIDDRHLSSAGRPLAGIEVAIEASTTGEAVPSGEVGEILLRGEQVMAGYWRQPAATKAALLPGGWLRTGDAGYLDDDGYLFVVDRIKDMIISGGENIYAAEVERVLGEHPSVDEVAVIGVPDEKWGEVPKAVVVPVGPRHPDAAELLRFCRGQLAGYKCPKSLDFASALPRNGAGKILKRALREQYRRGATY
ncbi:long-chain fatty acid--CoA ligase [Pseudonocardia yunnanensis]